jgi:hypothetical protein
VTAQQARGRARLTGDRSGDDDGRGERTVTEVTEAGGGDSDTSTLRKLALPTAVTAVGAAAGVVLTQEPKLRLRQAASELQDLDVGSLAGDLRDRLGSVLGKDDRDGDDGGTASPALDPAERHARRAERKERRERRRHNAT